MFFKILFLFAFENSWKDNYFFLFLLFIRNYVCVGVCHEERKKEGEEEREKEGEEESGIEREKESWKDREKEK